MNGTAALKNCLTCSDSPAVVFIFNISLYSVLHVLCCCTNTRESLHMQAYHNNPPHHTCVDFSNPSLHAQICYLAGDLYCIRDYHTYHISLIRRCGYYFFCCTLGAATIRGRRLFLWKARRHQQQLDKVRTSNTVTIVRHCQ